MGEDDEIRLALYLRIISGLLSLLSFNTYWLESSAKKLGRNMGEGRHGRDYFKVYLL